MELTPTDSGRLARIRANAEEWCALDSCAENWDSMFLIRIIDRLAAAYLKSEALHDI